MTNIYAVALAVVPAILNIGILFYLLFFLPRGKTTNLFALFIVALTLWQVQDAVARTVVDEDTMQYWHRMLCIGWFSVAPLVLHFVVRYTSRRKRTDARLLGLIYAPFLLLYTHYLSQGSAMDFYRDDFWGWLSDPREGSLDLFQRQVISLVVIIALIILFRYVILKRNPTKRQQALLIAIGILIPTLQGTLTQVIFPTLYGQDIPLTSTFFTTLSLSTIIGLSRFKLFDVAESLDVEGVLENLHNFVIILSPQGKVIYYNSYAASKLGMNRKKNHDLYSIFQKNQNRIKSFRNDILKKVLTGAVVQNYETEFMGPDGETIYVLLSSEVVKNNNLVQGILIIATDISSKKEEEAHLRLLESVIINSTDMVVISEAPKSNEVPKIIYTNNAFNAISGFTSAELQGQPLYNVHGTSYTEEEWRNNFCLPEIGDVTKVEMKHLKKSGEEYWVEINCFTVEDNQGQISHYVNIQRDITESRKHIQAIQKQNRRMKEIAWTQSHIVRAPLARLMGLVDILKNPGHQESDRTEILNYIEESAHELDQVIRDIVEKTSNMDDVTENNQKKK